MKENYPNPTLLTLLGLALLAPDSLIPQLNPAQKKKERLEAICEHLETSFLHSKNLDVVLMQEIWFRKDYEKIKNCSQTLEYKISNFDSECGRLNPVSINYCKTSKYSRPLLNAALY